MADLATVDLNSLLDGQKLRAPTIIFVAVAILALVSDGYDLSAMGYVAPELVKSWHVAQPDLVPVFSAGIIGLLVGAPLLGFIGDRFGRKKAILLGLCAIGVATLASALARSLSDLTVLRFLTGIGLGGLIPNIIALAAEIAPRRVRGSILVLVSFGMPAGFALSGLVHGAVEMGGDGPVMLDRALQRSVRFADVRRAHYRNLGCRGLNAAGQLLQVAADGSAAVSERMLIAALKAAGISGWRVNRPLALPTSTVVPDFTFVTERLLVEVDGWAWHSSPARFRRDRQRQNEMVAAGWQVLRFTWFDLTERPAEVINQIRLMLRR